MQVSAALAALKAYSIPVSLHNHPGVGCEIRELFLEQHISKFATGDLSSNDHASQAIGVPAMTRSHASFERRSEDRKPAWLAANQLSFVSEAALIAFSDVMFALGDLNERHRHSLLDRFLRWEKLVDAEAVETKRLFRLMIDQKIAVWKAEAGE
jgi:hypothetical protein